VGTKRSWQSSVRGALKVLGSNPVFSPTHETSLLSLPFGGLNEATSIFNIPQASQSVYPFSQLPLQHHYSCALASRLDSFHFSSISGNKQPLQYLMVCIAGMARGIAVPG
jgi:hypothetical protein